MRKIWRESHGIMQWLVVAAVILIVLVLFKEGVLTTKALTDRKDLIDTTAKLLGALAVVIGGLLSYYKFFKGRTIIAKLNVSITAKCFRLRKKALVLHCIDVVIKNTGSVAIWNYSVDLYMIPYCGSSKKITSESIVKTDRQTVEGEELIDVGEVVTVHALVECPEDIDIISYEAVVRSIKGTEWSKITTVLNTPCATESLEAQTEQNDEVET